MLTEGQVSRSWTQLFESQNYTDENFDRAEVLIDELRDESPLRHRLSQELEELRKIHSSAATGR